MHYLGLALYAEGPTDYAFLRPLLHRLCEDMCVREAISAVDLGEVIGITHPSEVDDADRGARIREAARAHLGAWRLLFIHADAEGNAVNARRWLVEPGLAAIQGEFAANGRGIAVIPIRETEAWALCDGDALRKVFGSSQTDQELGVPTDPRALEALQDPKATLRDAFLRTKPTVKWRRRGVSPLLSSLGEAVSLPRLRHMSSFRMLEDELREALHDLRVLTE